MRTSRTLAPGQPGTKKLVEKYGERLICVRYRYDPENGIKTKTIEIVIDQNKLDVNKRRIPPNKMMHIQVDVKEYEIRNIVKAAGGRWNNMKKIWELPYREVANLGLEDRIVKEGVNLR